VPNVVDIERVRADRLAADLLPAIREAFADSGIYKVSTDGIEDVDRWRRAARACARQLGVSCSTAVSADRSFVWIVDTCRPPAAWDHLGGLSASCMGPPQRQ
jgi:hypothetical protein